MIKKVFNLLFKKIGLLWKIPLIYQLELSLFPIFWYIFICGIAGFFGIRTGNIPNLEFLSDQIKSLDIAEIIPELELIAILLIFSLYIDRFSTKELGISFSIKSIFLFIIGVALAAILMSICFFILLMTGSIEIKGFYWKLNPFGAPILPILTYQIILLFIVGFQEELACRAYLIKNLNWTKPYIAITIPALIFTFLHVDNLANFSTNLVIGLSTIFIIGLLYGCYFYYTGDLWLVIGSHFSWNFVLGSVFGFSISGDKSIGLIVTEVKGSTLLTGGDFGPEGGFVVFGMFFIVFILYVTYLFRKKKGVFI